MTHMYVVKDDGINRWYAACNCGWRSLMYNNSTAANTAGQFHVEDEA